MSDLARILHRAQPRPQPVARVVREQTAVDRLIDLTRATSAITSTYTEIDAAREADTVARLARLTAALDDPWKAASLLFGDTPR